MNRTFNGDKPVAGPLFPGDIGRLLRDILDPDPRPTGGPPWTHTFRNPPDEYDAEGNVLPRPIEPSLTIVRAGPRRPSWLGGTDG